MDILWTSVEEGARLLELVDYEQVAQGEETQGHTDRRFHDHVRNINHQSKQVQHSPTTVYKRQPSSCQAMSGSAPQPPPAWQTEELQDEWVELDNDSDSDNDDHNLTYGTRSISLTAPLATHIHTNSDYETHTPPQRSESPPPVGTFLIREDVPSAPLMLLPKTPGRQKKGAIKDFFSPLPLERMFEPPSPPVVPPSALSRPSSRPQGNRESSAEEEDEIIETDMLDMNSFHGRKASIACQFTFAVPRETSLNPNLASNDAFPQAQSTPNPPFAPNGAAPTTDPRLRLFQFQYDTYTREHLSAMVDSIAVNSGTGTTPSPTSLSHHLSRVSEVTGSVPNTSHLRSTKRVKLSPRSDFYGEGAGAGASIARPKIFGKDYVGESQSLMQQIKQARDFSTISTVVSSRQDSPSSEKEEPDASKERPSPDSSRRPSFLTVPDGHSNPSNGGSYSSSTYRQQAAALMAQIKNDMKGQKRVFSGETDASYATTHVDDKLDMTSPSNSPDPISIHIPPYSPDGKDNVRDHGQRRTFSVRSSSSRHKPSLRKSSRRTQASSGNDSHLAEEVSHLSIQARRSSSEGSLHLSHRSSAQPRGNRVVSLSSSQNPPAPSTLAPPSYPSSSIRVGANEDLNRFVSSSTASGTTLTAGSAPSFVKHAGPAHIRTIAPTDLPQLPDRLGDMLFDKVMMKWVKNTAQAMGDHVPPEEASEDPFGDIESLRDDTRSEHSMEVEYEWQGRAEMSRIEEQPEMDDEEVELTSFSTDQSALIVDVMTGVETMDDDGETTDSADEMEAVTITEVVDYDSDDALQQSMSMSMTSPPMEIEQSLSPRRPTEHPASTTPHRHHSVPTSGTTPIVRSALKSHTATPTSALKDPHRSKYQTPLNKKGHRRSVSFSDGRRDGPILGLGESTDGGDLATDGLSSLEGHSASEFVPSARSKRIAQMMDALEDSESDVSPSKTSSSGAGRTEIQALSARQSSVAPPADTSRRSFSRSRTHRGSSTADDQKANATFLTECSFAVSHDRLVEVITDVQPFMPYWEELSSVDLSDKNLESVARLKEFLPRLDSLTLNANQLAWLSGIPGTVRTLSVASNSLTGLTSFSHLLNLEHLDISRNDIESLNQLACLRHLRELKADGNKITSIDGLQRMDGLVKISLQGNSIRSVDLTQYRWTRLEMLNMSQNRIETIHGLASLQALIALNIDNNEVGTLELDGSMPKLRILRVSGNRLHQLHVASMPNLRTLYADNNSLSTLVKVDRLTKLENLSLRNQSGRGLSLLTRDVRDVKRLYLSGNPLKSGFLSEPCYNLLYLEMAACRLTALPEDMSRLVPNLRVLNLNYNFLEDARPLEGLTRLRKLTMIGSRLKGTKPLIRLLQRMPDVEMLDFRMNPCTLGWYLPLLVRDIPGALQPSEGTADGGKGERAGHAWQELDSKFRRDLPDESYIGRLAYRGLIMRGCTRIRLLDGVEVTEKERQKAHHLLVGILGKGRKGKGATR
ncbi:Septation initiation network scaffold protein cdc11 [Hypsizygus marmoreus]|uniref:Septation initiation network scaffold protein cdc11 n=1 Tax=Hypsizygus marmoreus TaxID=39966 RepID=A0A369JBV0_HYPMA|nr:Septation initiation network scaffold protein cdc11 [Hypsizygus marmoreus]